mmetsp:Transcript_20610/g.68080  ORF Transcript_20610/g.68080 Transcript_20610/m.68080 type:complete len:357 (+) Transcript_20610:73-1143(+)
MLAISCVFLSFSSAPVPDGGAGVCVTGCSPYTEPPFPTWSHMVSEMSKECKLMVHVGDTKSGSGVCDDDLMAGPLRIMVATGTPTLYTLGDNEATDCHRMKTRGDYTADGGSTCKDDPCTYPRESQFYQAEAARTYMIEQFMTDTTTDLTGKLPVTTQSEECPFNTMVVVDKMLVAPIEMPGSNFGLSNEANMEFVDPYDSKEKCATDACKATMSHLDMFHRANNCNMAWIEGAAFTAANFGLKAVIIPFHARWWTDPPNGGVMHEAAYGDFYSKMKNVTKANPDIMFYTVHADSHYWITFSPDAIENWVNVMVEGSTRGLTSFGQFKFEEGNDFDPVSIKEVHRKTPEEMDMYSD